MKDPRNSPATGSFVNPSGARSAKRLVTTRGPVAGTAVDVEVGPDGVVPPAVGVVLALVDGPTEGLGPVRGSSSPQPARAASATRDRAIRAGAAVRRVGRVVTASSPSRRSG